VLLVALRYSLMVWGAGAWPVPKLAHQSCVLSDFPFWRARACLLSYRRQTAFQEGMDARTSYAPRSRPVSAIYPVCTGTTAGVSPASSALRAWLAGPQAWGRRPWTTRSGEPLLRCDGPSSHGSQKERACGVRSHVPSWTASTAKGNRMSQRHRPLLGLMGIAQPCSVDRNMFPMMGRTRNGLDAWPGLGIAYDVCMLVRPSPSS
jgi:hypothetical protein